jgi:hypothetical protein
MKTMLDTVKALAANGDYLGVVRAASGSYCTDLWAAAMTAHFGTTGLHKCWQKEDGTPSDEALERLPRLAADMEDARRRVARLVEHYERAEVLAARGAHVDSDRAAASAARARATRRFGGAS